MIRRSHIKIRMDSKTRKKLKKKHKGIAKLQMSIETVIVFWSSFPKRFQQPSLLHFTELDPIKALSHWQYFTCYILYITDWCANFPLYIFKSPRLSTSPEVNFINAFTRSFFACRSQKRKKLLNLTVFFGGDLQA